METIKLGKYKHYKGKEYTVLGFATHSETSEKLVIYKANYGDCEVWARPCSMWNEMVNIGEITVPRFTYIGD